MIEGWVRGLLVGACAAVGHLSPAGAQQGLPAPVSAAIEEAKKGCGSDKLSLERGFVTRKDVNGDGVLDYVLDYGHARCEPTGTTSCGSAGCLTQVFASLDDGTFVKALDENVQDVQFRRVKGRPAMVMGLHGTACGRSGAAQCGTTLYWNGSRFSPAN